MAESHTELQTHYEDFLRVERLHQVERITTAVDDFTQQSGNLKGWGCPRVRIFLNELRSESPQLAQRLRHDPLRHVRALEWACHAIAKEERPGYDKSGAKMKVALCGPVGAAPLSPRELTSSYLRQLVCVEGVATKISAIKPKVMRSVHYCPKTGEHQSREYVDATDPQLGLPALDTSGQEQPDKIVGITTTVYPTKDKDGNTLETEYGLSQYKDHQTAVLQEMPERAPMGQLPRSIDLVLDHDLVDKLKPGDRVQVVGVYRALATASSGQTSTSGIFRTVLLVNHVQILGRDGTGLTFAASDIREIRNISKRNNILSLLARSIAPSIHGHEVIKKALILQLLSGAEKNLANGTHLRGDINILLVGDPSCGKSQLLRCAMQIAPLAVSTTGKGSSGVGLTAAVTTDPDTRERRLEAGAMVLADRGLVCVDEFDKMSEADRVTIHEAMEQQTVTIAKAGIHASLNARCSVLAAANPVYGQYDRKRRLQENIGLPDSLLSRFDLLFIVLDQLDPLSDRRIATHVVRAHRSPFLSLTAYQDDHDEDSDDENISRHHPIWKTSYNSFTTSNSSRDDDPHSTDVLHTEFLRKYLHFAKARVKPILTDEAREAISMQYAEIRNRYDEQRTLPITARSLETLIRLATAHAKARLCQKVEAEPDCTVAMDILSYALYHDNNHNIAEEQPSSNTDQPITKKARVNTSPNVKELIWNVILANEGQVSVNDITIPDVDNPTIQTALQEMEKDDRIMIADDTVYLL